MYLANLDDYQPGRYCQVHRALQRSGAPPSSSELHFCGRASVVGNLYMIVMDRVDEKSIWQLPIPEIVPTNAEEAVRSSSQ